MMFLLAGMPFLFSSCVGEDRDDCDPDIRLGFRFAPDTEHDMLAEHIADMDVFIFDNQGLYLSTVTVANPRMDAGAYIPLTLKAGTYQFVAWGNLSCEHYNLSTTPVVGQTTVADLQLTFACPSDNTVDYTFDHLFYGSLTGITITEGMAAQEVIVPIEQDTYTIEVSISSRVTTTQYRVSIDDTHHDYNFRNEIITSDPISFIGACSPADDEPACIRTLKLTENSPTTFSIAPISGTRSSDAIYSASLITLLKASNTFAPDVKHTYIIELELNDAGTVHSITIEDWKLIVDDDIPLGPQSGE